MGKQEKKVKKNYIDMINDDYGIRSNPLVPTDVMENEAINLMSPDRLNNQITEGDSGDRGLRLVKYGNRYGLQKMSANEKGKWNYDPEAISWQTADNPNAFLAGGEFYGYKENEAYPLDTNPDYLNALRKGTVSNRDQVDRQKAKQDFVSAEQKVQNSERQNQMQVTERKKQLELQKKKKEPRGTSTQLR